MTVWVQTTDLKNSDLKKIFMDQAPQDKILKGKYINTALRLLALYDLDVEEFILEHF